MVAALAVHPAFQLYAFLSDSLNSWFRRQMQPRLHWNTRASRLVAMPNVGSSPKFWHHILYCHYKPHLALQHFLYITICGIVWPILVTLVVLQLRALSETCSSDFYCIGYRILYRCILAALMKNLFETSLFHLKFHWCCTQILQALGKHWSVQLLICPNLETLLLTRFACCIF